MYGWAMSQNLLTGGFKWVENPDELKGHISKLAKKSGKVYLLEVDMLYHGNLHNDLPFMCEKMKIKGVQKLVHNLFNKRKYVIHVAALDQAIKHGLVLQQIHWVIEFNQSAWLAPYIEFNTQLRTRAKNDFEKNFFKLMNNSVFGKMMKNIRKHRDIKLITSWEAYLKKVMKPNFKSGLRIKFSENLMACEMGKI